MSLKFQRCSTCVGIMAVENVALCFRKSKWSTSRGVWFGVHIHHCARSLSVLFGDKLWGGDCINRNVRAFSEFLAATSEEFTEMRDGGRWTCSLSSRVWYECFIVDWRGEGNFERTMDNCPALHQIPHITSINKIVGPLFAAHRSERAKRPAQELIPESVWKLWATFWNN